MFSLRFESVHAASDKTTQKNNLGPYQRSHYYKHQLKENAGVNSRNIEVFS